MALDIETKLIKKLFIERLIYYSLLAVFVAKFIYDAINEKYLAAVLMMIAIYIWHLSLQMQRKLITQSNERLNELENALRFTSYKIEKEANSNENKKRN